VGSGHRHAKRAVYEASLNVGGRNGAGRDAGTREHCEYVRLQEADQNAEQDDERPQRQRHDGQRRVNEEPRW
jgi:hypothetical protein